MKSFDTKTGVPRIISVLGPSERTAVVEFTKLALERHPSAIKSISLYAAGAALGPEDVEVLVLTTGNADEFEESVLDLVAEIVVTTGVYLTVKCLEARQFKAYQRAGLPLVRQIEASLVALYGA